LAIVVHDAKLELGSGITLLGKRAKLAQRRRVVMLLIWEISAKITY
jgi:hypothetical protein